MIDSLIGIVGGPLWPVFLAVVVVLVNHLLAIGRERRSIQRQSLKDAAKAATDEQWRAEDAARAADAERRNAEAAGAAIAEQAKISQLKADAERIAAEDAKRLEHTLARNALVDALEWALSANKNGIPSEIWNRDSVLIFTRCQTFHRGLNEKKQREFAVKCVVFNNMIQHVDAKTFAPTLEVPAPLGPTMAGRGVTLNYAAGREVLAHALEPILEFARAG